MQSFEERSVRSWSEESNGTKTGGQKTSFLGVAVAAPARVFGLVSYSPLRRVALRDAMRALSCAPHAIAATFEDTAADLAQERRGADDATMGGRVGGILSIRGPEVSPRPLRVLSIHVQSPTPPLPE